MMANDARRKDESRLEQVGQRIREARERLGLTQEALGRLIGRTQYSISQYESGSRAIAITELPTLAQVLEVPIGYFFGDIDDPDIEGLDLLSELKALSLDEKKMLLDRWRLDLEWWKKQHPRPELLTGSD
jgi:transcriptional regulator with XRE-family HTH domain